MDQVRSRSSCRKLEVAVRRESAPPLSYRSFVSNGAPAPRAPVGRRSLASANLTQPNSATAGHQLMREAMMRRMSAGIVFLFLAGNAAAQDGKAAYERSCAACHGDRGQGQLAPGLVPFTRGSQEFLRIVRAGAGT